MGITAISPLRIPGVSGVVLVAVILLFTAGCTSPSLGPETPYHPPEIVVQYARSGGIAGFDDRLVIFDTGQAVYIRGQVAGEFTLSPDELRELSDLLAAADFPSLNTSYQAPAPGADYFQHTITYREKTVSAETGGIPDVLVPLLVMLDDLLSERAQHT